MRRDILEKSRRLRRQRAMRRFLIWVFVIAILGALVVAFFYIPRFRIKNISVKGTLLLSAGDLISEVQSYISQKYFFVFPRDNFFLLKRDDLSRALRIKFPRIRTVVLDKDFPRTLNVIITERDMAALWCRNLSEEQKECALLDRDGVIFAGAPDFSGLTLFKLYDERPESSLFLGETVLPAGLVNDIFVFRDSLKKELNQELAAISIKSDGIFEFAAVQGWGIILNDKTDFKIAFDNLRIAFKTSIESRKESLDYVDLRFGSKVFYKFK